MEVCHGFSGFVLTGITAAVVVVVGWLLLLFVVVVVGGGVCPHAPRNACIFCNIY